MNLQAVLAIARKDVVDAVRNMYVFFGLLFPIGLSLLFQVAFPSDSEFKLGPVAVYDQGSSKLVEQLKAEPSVKGMVEVRSLDELTATVRAEALGGLAIPADFDAAVADERSPELKVLVNGRRGGGERAAFGRLVEDQVRRSAGKPPVARLIFSDVNAEAPGGAPTQFSTSGFFVMTLLVLGLAMTGSFVVPTLLVEEKEKRTLKAILVSPASYVDVVAGKALAGLFYALLGAVVLVLLNGGFQGNVGMMALAILLGGLSMVEVGLLMGALFGTTAQVNTWSSLVMLALIVPTWGPMIMAPGPVESATRAIPSYYLVRLFEMARAGGAWGAATSSIGLLAAYIVVLFGAIVWALRRAEQ